MRAVRAHDRIVEVVDVPRPTGDGVRVAIRSAGICGSDLHLIDTASRSARRSATSSRA